MKMEMGELNTTLDIETYADLLRVRALPEWRMTGPRTVLTETRHLDSIGVELPERLRQAWELSDFLFDYQQWLVRMAVERERFAIFSTTGTGKTACLLDWSRIVTKLHGGRTLIVSPANIVTQTIDEATKFYGDSLRVENLYERVDLERWLREGSGIGITNYEKLDGTTEPLPVQAVVCDESSVLKASMGSRRTSIIAAFRGVRFKLCCSATPAPNDRIEYAEHAYFLDVVRSTREFLANFFVNRDGQWQLKTHGIETFYRHLASWSVFMRFPTSYGFKDNTTDLPPLEVKYPKVELTTEQREAAQQWESGNQPSLFGATPGGITSRTKVQQIAHGFELDNGKIKARYPTLKPSFIASLVNEKHADEQVIVWVTYDEEGDQLARLIPEAKHLSGKTSRKIRDQVIETFRKGGNPRVLILKSSMFGFGLNLQACTVQVFSTLTDSFERFFQAVRRSHRFGQTKPVRVYIPLTILDDAICRNVMSKEAVWEADASRMEKAFIAVLRPKDTSERRIFVTEPQPEMDRAEGESWTLIQGDSVVHMATMPANSMDLAIFSPPFANLFTYSSDAADMGNVRSDDEYRLQWEFFVPELLRILKPGRVCLIHCMDVIRFAGQHGYRYTYDYPSDLRVAMEKAGFIYTSRIAIDKNPQALRNGTPVLTPMGWCAVELLNEGDAVIGSVGQATKVQLVRPLGRKQMYRVRFTDGQQVDCHGGHLWTVRPWGRKWSCSLERQWETLTTEEIMATLKTPTGKLRYEIPLVQPVEFALGPELPIDPYVLGVLLGDGCISQRSTIEFMTEPEIADEVGRRLPISCRVIRRPKKDRTGVGTFSIVSNGPNTHHPILDALRQLGLQEKHSWEKFIPEPYLRANKKERLELLRGLMDTDGTCKPTSSYFATTSPRLASGVMDIVQSLGGLSSLKEEHPIYDYRGERRNGRVRFLLTPGLPPETNPFFLRRKAERWHRSRTVTRRIASIEAVDEDECTCIAVEADDGLFVTKGYIITHNTQAVRTKDQNLLFVTLKRDALDSHSQASECILRFRKRGEPETPVIADDISNEEWIAWAHHIWFDCRETRVLNTALAKEQEDERHICPLSLDIIDRCVRLWTNKGEMVFSPFAGIGSEGYGALSRDRRFYGVELKRSYFETACRFLAEKEEAKSTQLTLL